MVDAWLPEWWYDSPTCRWLASEGIWLGATLLHACCLAVEISILRLYGKLPYKEHDRAGRSVWILMILHSFVWVTSLSALDGGAFYMLSAIIWGVVTALMANRAQHRLSTAKQSEERRQDGQDIQDKAGFPSKS